MLLQRALLCLLVAAATASEEAAAAAPAAATGPLAAAPRVRGGLPVVVDLGSAPGPMELFWRSGASTTGTPDDSAACEALVKKLRQRLREEEERLHIQRLAAMEAINNATVQAQKRERAEKIAAEKVAENVHLRQEKDAAAQRQATNSATPERAPRGGGGDDASALGRAIRGWSSRWQMVMSIVVLIVGVCAVIGCGSFTQAFLTLAGSVAAGLLAASCGGYLTGRLLGSLGAEACWLDLAGELVNGDAPTIGYVVWVVMAGLGIVRSIAGCACGWYAWSDDVQLHSRGSVSTPPPRGQLQKPLLDRNLAKRPNGNEHQASQTRSAGQSNRPRHGHDQHPPSMPVPPRAPANVRSDGR